jgi:hypothetical protein
MAFSHSRHIDASRSTFNSVGGNQLTVYNIHFSLFGSGRTHLPHNFDTLPRPTSVPDTSSQEAAPATAYHSSSLVSEADTALGIIVQIKDLLIDGRDSSYNHMELVHALKSLQEILIFVKLAVQEYNDRPLSQSLAYAVTPAMLQCNEVLQHLLEKVDGTRIGLQLTSIAGLWSQVWQSRWDGDDLVALRLKLIQSRKLLGGYLVALHEYVVLFFRARQIAET